MGMSTHVVGFRPPDEKWQRMKAVYDACQTAGVEPPEEVRRFFNWEPPDARGVEVDLSGAVNEWADDMQQGCEIHVQHLPADVTVVRVYNSW